MTPSKHTFPQALRDAMAAREISFRQLAIQTGRYRESPFSVGTFTQWVRGERRPTMENIEIVAKALNVQPTYFREYREHLAAEAARRISNEVGLDRVLAALRDLAA